MYSTPFFEWQVLQGRYFFSQCARTKVRKRDRIHLSDGAERYLSNNFSFSFERQVLQGRYFFGRSARTKVRKRDRIHLFDEAERRLSNNFSFSFERQAVQGGYVSGEARVQRYVSETEYIYLTKQSNIYQTILVFRLRDKLCKEDMYLAKRAYKGT